MQAINSTEDLADFDKKLKAISSQIRMPEPAMLWIGNIFVYNKKKKAVEEAAIYNEELYEKLPKEISVSPEIGEALKLNIDLAHKKDKAINAGDEEDFKNLKNVGVAIVAAIAFPHPAAIAGPAFNIYNFVKDAERKSKNFKKECNDSILGVYKLVEAEGKFKLVRGQWSVAEQPPMDRMPSRYEAAIYGSSLTDIVYPSPLYGEFKVADKIQRSR